MLNHSGGGRGKSGCAEKRALHDGIQRVSEAKKPLLWPLTIRKKMIMTMRTHEDRYGAQWNRIDGASVGAIVSLCIY